MADDNKERYINPYTDSDSQKVFWDNYSVIKTAEDKGHRKGLAEGRAEGRAEGEQNKALDIARNLKSMGLSTSDIINATGLSEDVISNL